MGQLIPIMCDEVVPGDFFKIGNQCIIRFQPMVAPALHEINLYVHYFFVPYRILWNVSENVSWEAFISGGSTGSLTPTLPRWDPTNYAAGSLWDFLGFPPAVKPHAAQLPMAFPLNAYNMIFNEYYRDETLTAKVDLTTQEAILYRSWEKDYFTSALPWLQRGTAPALPISGSTSAVWSAPVTGSIGYPAYVSNTQNLMYYNASQNPYDFGTKATLEKGVPSIPVANLNSNTVSLSGATTFGVNDLRLAFQINVG